jgi:hypothetical protein
VQFNVEVAGRAASRAVVAFAADADLGTVVHARRDLHGARVLDAVEALAATVLAGVGDRGAFAATARAGGDVHELAEEGLLDAADLALTLALRALGLRRAALLAGASTVRAALHALVVQFVLEALDRLLQVDLDAGAEVRTGLRAGATAGGAAEEGVEDVAEPAEALVALEALRTCATDTGSTEAVVARALLGVTKDLVRGVDLLELGLRLRILVAVRVEVHGETTERLLQVILRGIPRDAEDGVEVGTFSGHRTTIVPRVPADPHRRLSEKHRISARRYAAPYAPASGDSSTSRRESSADCARPTERR